MSVGATIKDDGMNQCSVFDGRRNERVCKWQAPLRLAYLRLEDLRQAERIE